MLVIMGEKSMFGARINFIVNCISFAKFIGVLKIDFFPIRVQICPEFGLAVEEKMFLAFT